MYYFDIACCPPCHHHNVSNVIMSFWQLVHQGKTMYSTSSCHCISNCIWVCPSTSVAAKPL